MPTIGSFTENEYFLQLVMFWIDKEMELRLVSRPFKEAYDTARFFRLPPAFWQWTNLISTAPVPESSFIFSKLKPAIGLDCMVQRAASRAPPDFKSAVIAYLKSLPTDQDGHSLYFNAFKLIKVIFSFESRILSRFEFDMKRLAKIIASRPFNEAECIQLFISEEAPVGTNIDLTSGRNVFQEAVAETNLPLAKWILKYFGYPDVVAHLDVNRRNGLHYVCAYGDLEMVALIYAISPRSALSLDFRFELPITKAIKRDCEAIVKFLRSKQNPINGTSSRENSVFAAIATSSIKSLQVILQDASFDPSQMNRRRQTIWQAALLSKDIEVVKMIFHSRHSRFSADKIEELGEWSRDHSSRQIHEFIEEYYYDFLHDQRQGEYMP